SSLTLTISSWVVFRSSSDLVTLSAKSMRALLPLRLSWVTPAARIGKAIDASMTRTTSTFPAVDIGSLLPRSQRVEGRRNRTCQAQDNACKNLSTARRLFWEPRAMNGYLSDRVQVTLERFTFASPTCSPQPRIHGLQMIGVFSSRVAATVHSLEAKAPGCPQATPALPRSEPQSGRQEGSATARACRPAGAGKGFFCVSPGPGADAPQAMNCRSFGAWGVYLVYFVVRSFRLPRCQWYDRAIVSAWAAH